ncbi:MAG: phosphatidate cytidylyltransferase [Bacteroidia bacterium]|nr:phosphatidate cytidylyltransferase [Bacteroidia bacterium]
MINIKDATTRIGSGLIFLSIFIGSIWYGGYSFVLLFTLLAGMALKEYFSLFRNGGLSVLVYVPSVLGALLFLVLGLEQLNMIPSGKYIGIPIALFFLFFFYEMLKNETKPIDNLSSYALGLIYVLLPLIFFQWMAFYKYQEYTFQVILGHLIIIWANDTGAYGFGVTFGKHRILERISPKKSWEGAAGGLLFGLTAAYIWSQYNPILSTVNWIVVAIIIMVTGTLGDFVESMFKRHLGVKDSGSIMPGHGGMLDRFDSVLLSAPFVWAYLEAFC